MMNSKATQSTLRMLRVSVALVVLLASVSLTAAQGTTASRYKPLQGELGTWKQNLAKSKFEPGPGPRTGAVSKRELVPDGVKVTTTAKDPQGRTMESRDTWIYDGKDHALYGAGFADAVARKRIDDFTVESALKKGDTVLLVQTTAISKDGKLMTVTLQGVTAQGQRIKNVTVWEKQ
jgi:hypothetical protein